MAHMEPHAGLVYSRGEENENRTERKGNKRYREKLLSFLLTKTGAVQLLEVSAGGTLFYFYALNGSKETEFKCATFFK